MKIVYLSERLFNTKSAENEEKKTSFISAHSAFSAVKFCSTVVERHLNIDEINYPNKRSSGRFRRKP